MLVVVVPVSALAKPRSRSDKRLNRESLSVLDGDAVPFAREDGRNFLGGRARVEATLRDVLGEHNLVRAQVPDLRQGLVEAEVAVEDVLEVLTVKVGLVRVTEEEVVESLP